MNNDIISYDKKGFIINGKREFLIGGEFHYFRVPAELWEDRLQKMRNTGANLISVYIPWNMHEPEEGKERWTGDYDLERFLSLCEEYGFYILIKPGPYVCAELDFGGHPDWLITKIANREFRIRMLDEGYLKLCMCWYKRVSEKINGHLITNGGNIIAAQIENEYDHLIEYGEETITVQDAIDYFLFLRDAMEEYGIDVPKFANEAAFLRGRDIIDTRTYYPNIPGLWMWEFDLFEGKIIDSKKSQSNSPVMILELQAGWFSQIGAPTYEPGLDVVEGVSKSVLIQGASIINYYMMVGGTTFPFIGARGDTVFMGGLGNITSYDFGASPIRESGEVNKDKFYWIKGFIRFAREFSGLILDSDGRSYVNIVSGGENIAVLGCEGAVPDTELKKSGENFKVYEEGNENGRFFFIRNLEKESKTLTLSVDEELLGSRLTFKTTVKAKETRMLPVSFKIPGTGLVLGYSTSEVLLSGRYENSTAFVMFGKTGTEGETLLYGFSGKVEVLKGEVEVTRTKAGTLLKYSHKDISIVQIGDARLFFIEEEMIGRVEEMPKGLLFHSSYYLHNMHAEGDSIGLEFQVKDGGRDEVRFFSMTGDAGAMTAELEGNQLPVVCDKASGMHAVSFSPNFTGIGPEAEWTSQWKYIGDTDESAPDYDHSAWMLQDRPMSLEEMGLIEHGYYWFRTEFNLEGTPEMVYMDYQHNDTDRMFIYINGSLVYKSHNKKIKQKDITRALKSGKNTMAILYANEFHNKSHPHEGDIVKYSGIMHPIHIYGTCSGHGNVDVTLAEFSVKKSLKGILEGYHTLGYDDSSWNTVPGAGKFVVAEELGYVVWFRRKFRYETGESIYAPLKFHTKEADQRLTIYINGRPVARYDIVGPQEEFYIPEAYLNQSGENVISMILECPAFYDELQGGFRRGYLYSPELSPEYVAKGMKMRLLFR